MSLEAIKAEATGAETIEIEWRDHTFTIPASIDDLPYEFLVALEDGKSTRIVETVLGARRLAKLVVKERMRVRDFNELSDLIAVAYGFADSGE